MAYYLQFDGVNDNVTVPEVPRVSDGYLEINFIVDSTADGTIRPISRNASSTTVTDLEVLQDRMIIDTDGSRIRFSAGNAGVGSQYTLASWANPFAGPLVVGQEITIRIQTIPGSQNKRLFVDGVDKGLAATDYISIGGYKVIGGNYGVFAAIKLGYFRVVDNLIAANNREYSPSASGGVGSVLPETQSGLDGTLVNFPTDDSQWVFYQDSTGVSSDIAVTTNKPIVLANGSATLPQPEAIVTTTTNKPVVNFDTVVTLPQPEVSLIITSNKPTVVVELSASLPQPNVTLTTTSNKPTVFVEGSVELPYPILTVSTIGKKPTVDLLGSITLPQPDIQVVTQGKKPTIVVTGSAESLNPDVYITATSSKPTVLSSGQITLPNPISELITSAKKPAVIITGSATLLSPDVSLSVLANKPTVFSSGYIEIPNPDLIISVSVKKPSINLQGQSTLPNPELTIDVIVKKPSVYVNSIIGDFNIVASYDAKLILQIESNRLVVSPESNQIVL